MGDTLIEDIDKTARALLAKCRENDNVGEKGPPECSLFIEQVKGFQAVVAWAEARHKINPPPPPDKEPSTYDRLKQEFNGPAPSRRRNRRSKADKDDTPLDVGGADEPELPLDDGDDEPGEPGTDPELEELLRA